jgi:hypothetical protein
MDTNHDTEAIRVISQKSEDHGSRWQEVIRLWGDGRPLLGQCTEVQMEHSPGQVTVCGHEVANGPGQVTVCGHEVAIPCSRDRNAGRTTNLKLSLSRPIHSFE